MSIPIFTQVRVVEKSTKEGTDREGRPRTYYNLKVADTQTFDNQIIGVSEEVFKKVQEDKDFRFIGKCGGLKEKYWYFNEALPVPEKK